jgi:hypothetical protein
MILEQMLNDDVANKLRNKQNVNKIGYKYPVNVFAVILLLHFSIYSYMYVQPQC